AIEVTDHHGVATVGKAYSERNRTLGPLKTDSVWTVEEIVPLKRRVDTGVGFAPLQDITNIFEFRPVQTADGQEATEMLYQVEYTIGLGPLGQLLDSIQQPAMRAGMRTSMANLNTLLRSEASRTAR
ncbi:SRPBCC family protein, partial [Streptomyces ossamyceticus]|uniref:SRPBCC family protein n=1 Tax=Streptomyces ossamyceticus TaxID=249581 RepID=UPI0036E74764